MGPATALDKDPGPAFESQSVAVLYNADIQVDEKLRDARAQAATVPIVEAQSDEIVYEVELGAEELDEPDEGIHAPPTPLSIPNVAGYGAERYPKRSRRSVIGNLPYYRYLQFLQTSGMLNDVEHDQDLELLTQL